MPEVLLLEIGVEELPASFVQDAVAALPEIAEKKFAEVRFQHGDLWASGTPRRLCLRVEHLADSQEDLDEIVTGPPARIAFDAAGNPTKAALSFAAKLGCEMSTVERKSTPKGEYLVGRRKEAGEPTVKLLPGILPEICRAIPFRKSMRWSTVETTFGRPVQWILAMFGAEILEFEFAGITAGQFSHGHRFLAPDPFSINHPDDYVQALRERHVVVDLAERGGIMLERLHAAAAEAGGLLIEDAFLVGENGCLVEDPQIIAGDFDPSFLALPERVILDVAKGHQRYFGIRDLEGKLLPKYLAVAGTALNPQKIQAGNDRVMRARLADAKFFYEEDLKRPLSERRAALDNVVFHKRLGSIGDKVRRVEVLTAELGALLALPAGVREAAVAGFGLAKCDLVTLMVGELPELQGEMGMAYALEQGVARDVATVIAEHYQPRGADDPTAPSEPGALAALADRVDTLVGCFAVGLVPTGAADPLALRRAGIGLIRTLLDRQWDLPLDAAIERALHGYRGVKLDLGLDETKAKLLEFLRLRLRGVLTEPQDVIDACIAVSPERPYDVALRASALAALDAETRLGVGEVFKRAANIAKDAPTGAPVAPQELGSEVHPSEQVVFDQLTALRTSLAELENRSDYPSALRAISGFAPTLGQFFEDVFVMVEDPDLRNNRLRLMREIHETCSSLANFNQLAGRKVYES